MNLRRVFLVASLCVTALPSLSQAAPTVAGSTGIIKTPTAEVAAEGSLILGFSWTGGTQAYLFAPKANRMYYITMGLLPGLEASLDMLQVVGWVDPAAPGIPNAIHRLSNVKYRLPFAEGWWPRIAVGIQDPLSVNGLFRGPVGQTNYGLSTLYGVATEYMGPLAFHLGYAQSHGFIRGGFGALDVDLGLGFDVRAEHDSRNWNVGILWQPVDWLQVYGARLFPDDWTYGSALTWRL